MNKTFMSSPRRLQKFVLPTDITFDSNWTSQTFQEIKNTKENREENLRRS